LPLLRFSLSGDKPLKRSCRLVSFFISSFILTAEPYLGLIIIGVYCKEEKGDFMDPLFRGLPILGVLVFAV